MNLLPAWSLDLKTCLPLILALPGLASPALWAAPSSAQGAGQAPAATAANSPKQTGDTDGATWLARLAPSGQALDRALVERLLAEIDLDRRATNNLAMAQSRAAALEQRLANAWQNPADAESGHLWRQAFLLKSDLALAAGDSAGAWLAWNSRQPRPDVEPALAEAARALLSEPGALQAKEAVRVALLESLGGGKSSAAPAKHPLANAVEAYLGSNDLTAMRSLGRSAVPHLRFLAGQGRENFTPTGQMDPLRAYYVLDPAGALAYMQGEFDLGGPIWKLRVAQILFDHNGRPSPGTEAQLLDDLFLRALSDGSTSEFMLEQSRRIPSKWQSLPRVVTYLAKTIAEAQSHSGLINIAQALAGSELGRAQAKLILTSEEKELRSGFLRGLEILEDDERRSVRDAILSLAFDALPNGRRICAEELTITKSPEERVLRLKLLEEDPEYAVRVQAFLALVGEDDLERKSPSSPLGPPLNDQEAWATLERLSQKQNYLPEGCWLYALKHLPPGVAVNIWYSLLASDQETILNVVAETWREIDFGSVEQRGHAFVALWKRFRDLPNLASNARGLPSPSRTLANREVLDVVLTLLAAEGELQLVQRLIWSRMPSDEEDFHRLADLAKEAGPTGRHAMLKAHAHPSVLPGVMAVLLDALGPFDGQVLLEIAEHAELSPAMRLLAATQALSQGVAAAQAPLEEALGSPELAADFRKRLEASRPEWARYVGNLLERCPANAVNAVALNLLSRSDVPDSNLLFVVSTLGRLGAGSAEIARLCVTRWGQNFSREQWERGGLRFALLAVGPGRAFFDLDFVTRALQVPEYRDEAAQALGRRRDPTNLPLLAQELERFASGTLKYNQSDGAYFGSLVNSVAQIGTPAALALLADTAAAAENNDQRKFCLAQIDQMLRVEEARRVAAEQGALPRSRIAATGELLGMLSHADSKVRLAAIKGLGALGQPEVLPELIALLPGATPEFESAINAAIDLIAEASARSAPAAPGLAPRPGTAPEQEAETTPGE
jgi:hypothetical protein